MLFNNKHILLNLPEQVIKNTYDIEKLKETQNAQRWSDEAVDIFAHLLTHVLYEDEEVGHDLATQLIEALGGVMPPFPTGELIELIAAYIGEPKTIGDEFTKDDFEVTGVYDDETERPVHEFTITPETAETAPETIVTITKNDITTDVTVPVAEDKFLVKIPTVEGIDTFTVMNQDDEEVVDGTLVPNGTILYVTELTPDEGVEVEGLYYTMNGERHNLDVDAPVVVTGNITYDIELSDLLVLTENPVTNWNLMTQALAKGNVKLYPGEYPFVEGFEINGRTLDLNNSELTFSGHYDFVTLSGMKPTIKNGTIAGTYTKGPGEEGYEPIETATTPAAVCFRIGDCEDYVIEDIEMHNVPGYGTANGNLGLRTFSPSVAPAGNTARFNLSGYKYCTARSAVGHNYIISDESVLYTFSDGTEAYGVPGDYIDVPEGAAYVDVTTYGDYVQYGLFETNFNHQGTIEGLEAYCNQRLAIANLPSYCDVIDCHSRSNGYPREDHGTLAWDSSTSGFCDLEDTQPNYIVFRNCSSENENLGIATRAYNLNATNCSLDVRVYGGWSVTVDNCASLTNNSADAAFDVAVMNINTPVDNKLLLDNKDRDALEDYPVVPVDGSVYTGTLTVDYKKILWYGKNANGGKYKNCNITLNDDWIEAHGEVDLTFDHCIITANEHKLLTMLYYPGTVKGKLTFDHCTCDVDFNELVNNTSWVDIVVIDDTLTDVWGNTSNQLTDTWNNPGDEFIDEWGN